MSTSASPRVLVTGGGLGIGFSAVEFLLKQQNARVGVFTLDVGPGLKELQEVYWPSHRLFVCQGDVTKPEHTQRAIELTRQHFDGLDSLIVCAGIEPPLARIKDMTYDSFQRTFAVNVCGAFLSIQSALPLLLESTHARIVVLSSTGDKAKYAGRAAYCCSKAALTRLIDILNWEHRDNPKLDIYGVYPGLTKTPMAEAVLQGTYENVLFPEEAERYRTWVKEGAVDPPEWCADACARLATGAAEGLRGQTTSYSAHVPELKLGRW